MNQILDAHGDENSKSGACASKDALWFAAYTRSRHEKRIGEMLTSRGVEHYLPLYEAVHAWKDRRARVQLPLFPCYVFVNVSLIERMRVLTTPGVIRLVGHPCPTPLPAFELQAIRDYISQCWRVEPHPYITRGRRVRIKAGPLQGLEGIVVRRKSGWRVVINLDLIMRSMVVEVATSDLEAVSRLPVRAADGFVPSVKLGAPGSVCSC